MINQQKQMQFLQIKKSKGIYYDPEYRPEKLNISGALALFAPSYEELELLKQDLVENMQFNIAEAKRKRPIGLTQDEFDAWFKEEFGIGRKRMSEPQFAAYMEVQGWMLKFEIEQITEAPRRAIKRIVQRQQHLMKPAAKQGGVTEADIERAKESPIEDMITTKVFKATGKWIANCHCPLPGHEGERTPSFYIDKQNRFKCFGCQKSGDAIEFVMLRDKVKFIPAVKSLL